VIVIPCGQPLDIRADSLKRLTKLENTIFLDYLIKM